MTKGVPVPLLQRENAEVALTENLVSSDRTKPWLDHLTEIDLVDNGLVSYLLKIETK